MNIEDLVNASRRRTQNIKDWATPEPVPTNMFMGQEPKRERAGGMEGLLQMAIAGSQSAPNGFNLQVNGKGPGGVPEGFDSGGENPWGIDPNGMNLVTRRGVTLDQDAMRSLQQARKAGFNPFPYIGGGYRSPEASDAMYANRANRSLPVAPGGHSMHNFGLAFDQSRVLPKAVQDYLLAHGWYNGASWGDPPHWSYGRDG